MIKVEGLTKRYGGFTAVDDVSFTAEPGRVTGFLGPNGAGKSTAMRMMCGLTTPTAGTSTVFGKPFAALPNPGRRVGMLLDASAQHSGRTGRETLTLSALMMGIDRKRVDEMLELVGLTPRESGRRVVNYSLGMRQRLGIANALLGDPQVLILDEPANGLDPTGIRWMRSLLRDFAGEGGTVLLSSHLLLEMEAVCDDLVVIGQGSIVAQGKQEDLLAVPGTRVTSIDDVGLAAALTRSGFDVQRHTDGGLETPATREEVGRIALAEQVALTGLAEARNHGLEDLFFQLTADHSRQEVAA